VTETFVKKISACEMRMLRCCLGVSWEEHRSNEDIRKEARVVGIADDATETTSVVWACVQEGGRLGCENERDDNSSQEKAW